MFNKPADSPSDNSNNDYDPAQIATGTGLLNNNIREIATSGSGFNVTVNEGADYSKLENARKLTSNEYTFHPQLGYISLQQRLANDEVLAVAYQYTIGDQVYQVGEFGNDGVDATLVSGTTPSGSSHHHPEFGVENAEKQFDQCQKSGLEPDDEKHLSNTGSLPVETRKFQVQHSVHRSISNQLYFTGSRKYFSAKSSCGK